MEGSTPRRVVLDAYPVLALLRDESCAGEVGEVMARDASVMSVVTVAEVADVLVRVHHEDPPRVAATLASLLDGVIAVSQPDVGDAARAGLLRARWYRRRQCEISLGDCFVVVTAQPGDLVATADPLLAEVARGEGIEVIALPDSAGRRP